MFKKGQREVDRTSSARTWTVPHVIDAVSTGVFKANTASKGCSLVFIKYAAFRA